MKPTLSKAAQQLREQFDDTFADRDRRSDGWIGDPRHASRPSDHNPDPKTVSLQNLERSASLMSYSMAESHHLAWAGAGENIREAIRTTIIAISLSLTKVMKMARSLISHY